MLQQPPYSEYCASCSKCLDDEPVPIRCEICNQQICNNCRSIDNKKRTIVATSLTKSGGGKQPSGRFLNLIGSKLSVLTAFRSSLSKSSFEFDELEEEEQLSNSKNQRPQSATSQHGNDNEFDKYFEQQNKQYSERHQERHSNDRQTDKLNHELDKQSNQNLLDKHQFKHNKIEKQMSFQYSERRRRLSNFKTGEGGSLDIDNSKMIGNLLTVPIDQQQKQSHSDSSLNRQNSIDQQSTIRTNSSDQMNRLSQFDLNNNFYQPSINRSHQKLNRMISLDDRSIPIQQQIPKITKSPIHLSLERSTTVDCNYDNQIMKPRFKDNSNDFILSICVMCAKNFRSTSGGEWMKKITRSASEKLRRSGSISRTLINRSGLMKAQSNLMTNQNPILNTESNILQAQHHPTQHPIIQKHRHSTDAGSLMSNSSYLEQNLNNLDLNNKLDNNNLPIFKPSIPPSSDSLTVTTSSNALRTAHAQLTHVNSSPLPSAAHRLHQPVFNQTSQPIAIKSHQLSNYKSPPPPPSPTPNLLTQQQQQTTLTQQKSEYDLNQNYFLNQNLNQFDNSNMTTLDQQQTYVEQPYVDPTANITMQTKSMYLPSTNVLANNNINQSSYITPKYVRSNLINKKLPVLDCSKISSINPLVQQQQQFGTPAQQQTYNQPYRNPLTSTYNQIKSPPSSGSSLETNSPRSIMTTINSSTNSSPHIIHQSQSNFSANSNISQSNFNQGQSNIPIGNNINNIGSGPANLLNNSLNVMGKLVSDLVSSDTRSAAIQELRETVYRKVSTRFRSSSSTSSSSTSSSCSLSNHPSIDSHHVYHPTANLYNTQQLQSIQQQPHHQIQQPPQNIYHPLTTATNNSVDQNTTSATGQLATAGRQSSGRQLPHIPGPTNILSIP